MERRRATGVAALVVLVVVGGLTITPARGQEAATPVPDSPREVVSLRTESSATFEDEPGRFRTVVHESPVHFRDAEGGWRRIEAELEASHGGAGFDARPNSLRPRFRANPATSNGLTLDLNGYEFRLALADARPVAPSRKSGNGVVYRRAFQHADVEYEVLAGTLKETIVLHRADAPRRYRSRLYPPSGIALAPVSRPDGSVAVYSDSGEPLMQLVAPVVFDSAGAGAGGGPFARLEAMVADDGALEIVVEIEEEWLEAPERSFPVYLDPTISTETIARDGYYDTGGAANMPVTSSGELFIGSIPSGSNFRTALTFDTGSIPPGARVVASTMRLNYVTCVDTCPWAPNGQISLYRLTTPWDSATTWGQVGWDSTALVGATMTVGWNSYQPGATPARAFEGFAARTGIGHGPTSSRPLIVAVHQALARARTSQEPARTKSSSEMRAGREIGSPDAKHATSL